MSIYRESGFFGNISPFSSELLFAAFRKLTRDELPVNDCHYELRKSVIQSLGDKAAPTCISIAWDWYAISSYGVLACVGPFWLTFAYHRNFVGADSDGINRETATTVESLQRCRQRKVKALAPIGRAVLSMGAYIKDAYGKRAMLITGSRALVDSPNDSLATAARGILPSLKAVVQRELSSYDRASAATKIRAATFGGCPSRGHQLSRVNVPDIQKDPLSASIDARGNGACLIRVLIDLGLGGLTMLIFPLNRLLLQAVQH